MCLEVRCKTPDSTYGSVKALRDHYRAHHPHSRILNLESPMECLFCESSVSHHDRFPHMARHMEDISFSMMPQLREQWAFYSESSDSGSDVWISHASSQSSNCSARSPAEYRNPAGPLPAGNFAGSPPASSPAKHRSPARSPSASSSSKCERPARRPPPTRLDVMFEDNVMTKCKLCEWNNEDAQSERYWPPILRHLRHSHAMRGLVVIRTAQGEELFQVAEPSAKYN